MHFMKRNESKTKQNKKQQKKRVAIFTSRDFTRLLFDFTNSHMRYSPLFIFYNDRISNLFGSLYIFSFG